MTDGSSSGTSQSLLSRVRNEDSRAWRELVDLYTPLIAHWCQRKGLSNDAINDCIQDVFFAVLKSLKNYQPSGQAGSFRAWLWTITRFKIVDILRREGRQPQGMGGSTGLLRTEQLPDEIASESEPTEPRQLSRLLLRGLAQVQEQFEPKTWQAFWRTTVDGVPAVKVAEELGISPAAARKYRSRILRRLRQQLGDTI